MELSSVFTRRIEEERDSAEEGAVCMLVSRQKDSIRSPSGSGMAFVLIRQIQRIL